MSTPQITPFSKTPNRQTGKATYSEDTDTYHQELAGFVSQANNVAEFNNTKATETAASAASAEAAATNAAASETAAANSAAAAATNFDAPLWVANEDIAAGNKRRDPADGNVYKALTNIAAIDNTVAPSANSTDWRAAFLDFVTGYGDTKWTWFNFADSKSVAPEIEVSRLGQGSVFTAAGNYEEAYANQPLITHDPATGECLGLYSGSEFTEHQHNPLSVDTDTADFSTGNATKAITVLDQYGLSFQAYTADAVSAVHVVQGVQTRPSGAGTWISYAVVDMRNFDKASLRPVRLNDGGVSRTDSPALVFDKTTKTFSGQATVAGEVDDYNYVHFEGDVYLIWCEFSSDASTTAIYSQVLFIDPATGGSSYTGDGTTELYIAALGLREGGAKPPMLIPGGDSPTTALADVVKITGDNFGSIFGDGFGTIFGRLVVPEYNGGNAQRIFSVTNGTNSERLEAFLQADMSLRFSAVSGSAVEVLLRTDSLTPGTKINFAVSMVSGAYRFAANGAGPSAAIYTDPDVTPAGLSAFNFCSNVTGTAQLDGALAILGFRRGATSQADLNRMTEV